MQEEKPFDFYDKSIHDFGGKENYTKYLTLPANIYYLAFPNELENQFEIDQLGNVYVKTITKPATIGYYLFGFSTYTTPYLKWDENCNVLGIKYQDGKIDFSVLENCGYLKDAPKEVSPLTP